MQHDHQTTPFEKKEFPVVLVCDGVRGPANIGSLFRVCDAFGVSELVLSDTEFNPNSARMRKTARDTFKKVRWSLSRDLPLLLKHYREAGYLLLGLEIATNSEPIERFSWDKQEKLVLVVGNEQNGISGQVLSFMDKTLHIELFGVNSSINVTHATAIALFHLTRGE